MKPSDPNAGPSPVHILVTCAKTNDDLTARAAKAAVESSPEAATRELKETLASIDLRMARDIASLQAERYAPKSAAPVKQVCNECISASVCEPRDRGSRIAARRFSARAPANKTRRQTPQQVRLGQTAARSLFWSKLRAVACSSIAVSACAYAPSSSSNQQCMRSEPQKLMIGWQVLLYTRHTAYWP